MAEKILILGGAGFIGSSLAIGLKKRHPDWHIHCFDNLRRRGSELHLPRFKALGIQFTHGDIRSPSDLDPGPLDSDSIIDCSAEPSVLAGFTSPQYVLQTNLLGTINILELARQVTARLVFLSTSRVYPIATLQALHLCERPTRFEVASCESMPGISPKGVAENFPLQGHRSLYGSTKLASELLIEEYRHSYNLPAIINRCSVVTGPWQMGKVDQGVFALWIAAHFFQRPLNYIGYGGTGKQVRDLLHIDDLLSLIDYQLAHFDALDGEMLNVGGGARHSLSLQETTKLCEAITGNSIAIRPVLERRAGDVPVFITDTSRVTEKTGWQPTINPETTLKDVYMWLSEHEAILRPIFS